MGIKRVICMAAGALLALSMGAATAYFTAQVQVPDSMIRAGNVAVSAEPTSAPLSVDPLAPGQTVSRPMTVVNTGMLPADIVVSASRKAGITKFYESLECTASCGGVPLYVGPLSQMRTTPLRLVPGARSELVFDVGLPASVANTFSSDYARISLYVDAEQAH